MEIKTISGQYIVSTIFSDDSINHSNWIPNCKEWIGRAVRFIGKHSGLDTHVCCNILIENHSVCYPDCMEGLIAVIHNGISLPLGTDLSGIGITYRTSSTSPIYNNEDLLELNAEKARLNELNLEYAITPTVEIATLIEECSTRIIKIETALSVYKIYATGRKNNNNCDSFYNTKLDCIQTSFDTGYVDIIYKSFKVDKEGWLQIVDNEYNIEAIRWFVLMKLCESGYKHPIFDYFYCSDQFWGNITKGIVSWKKKASNNMKAMNIDEQERFTRMWTSIRFNREAYNVQFDGMQQQSGLYR